MKGEKSQVLARATGHQTSRRGGAGKGRPEWEDQSFGTVSCRRAEELRGTRCGLCSDQRPGVPMDTPAGQSGKRRRTSQGMPGEGRQSTGPQSPDAKRRSQSVGSGDYRREGGALGGRGNRKERLKKEEVEWRRAKRDRQWIYREQHRP